MLFCTELGQPGVKGVLGKRHSEQCFRPGICQQPLTSRKAQRTGSREADSGTASMCGKAAEKKQVEPNGSTFDVKVAAPLFGGSRPLTAQ